MGDSDTQSFKNHSRYIPAYHVVTFGIFVINCFWALYRAFTAPSGDTIVAALMSIALILLFFYARIFALTVQDRVIRLEMQLRMNELLPSDLRARAGELTVKQIVALRFASDRELPDLCRQVLGREITEPKAIKQAIRAWRPDHLRA